MSQLWRVVWPVAFAAAGLLLIRVAFAFGVFALSAVLLDGCYLEHEDAPCDAEVLPDSSTVEHVTVNHGDAGSNPALAAYPGPCPFKYDAVHCWCTDATHEVCDGRYCEGPYVGCIAPGSPVSSTWRGQ